MYGSWTENVVLWRNFLGIIWDLWDVFTVHICSARAQIQSLIPYRLFIFEGLFWELINNDDEKSSKYSAVK